MIKKLAQYRGLLCDTYEPEEIVGIDGLVLDNINDVIVTHIHGDHFAGLEMIAFYKKYVQKDAPLLNVYATPEVTLDISQALEPSLGRGGNGLVDFFHPVELVEGEYSFIGDRLGIEVFGNDHGIPCFAVMLSYAGRSLAYSSDTRFSETLLQSLSASNVLIHECDGGTEVHTSPEQLKAWLAGSSYNGRLYVCHLGDSVKPEEHGLTPLPEEDFINV